MNYLHIMPEIMNSFSHLSIFTSNSQFDGSLTIFQILVKLLIPTLFSGPKPVTNVWPMCVNRPTGHSMLFRNCQPKRKAIAFCSCLCIVQSNNIRSGRQTQILRWRYHLYTACDVAMILWSDMDWS